jgi:hypothetical protein
MVNASPEAIDRILKRYNINPDDYRTITAFQNALREKIGALNRGLMASMSQYFRETQFSFPKYNVTRLTYESLGTPTVRYGIPGQRGLFGYTRAAQYVMEAMEE